MAWSLTDIIIVFVMQARPGQARPDVTLLIVARMSRTFLLCESD